MASSDKIKASDVIVKDVFQNTVESGKQLLTVMENLEKGFKDILSAQEKILKNSKKGLGSAEGINKTTEALNKSKQARKGLSEVDKERVRLEKRLNILNKDSVQRNEEIKVQLIEQRKINKNLAREKLKLVGVYEKESKRLIALRTQYKNLALSEGESSKKAKELLGEITKLDTKLKAVDKTVGQSQRNVGNYGSAWDRVKATISKGLGLAAAAVGIRAIGRALRDSFERIRQFDKEMNNLAGIAGTTRKEMLDLESEIINVASSSIKTSNEVAKLATTLFTLGKTKREVVLLLKPVNDLSIALQSTSEETADFLGQTLNAFGKGADSGQRFADIIANIRSSTSLDFERIKDGFGFLAPTANALNLTVGQTGALLGVLQDNGIKAARAGRLLNSSFARLIDKGLSLEQALEKINNSQDKVATASNLFGKQSFALGLILADNTDRVAELSNEFDNLSEGSLKKLTDEQLKSVDAQLKILDSTWEKFILNIENGEGVISRSFKIILVELGKVLNGFIKFNQTFQEKLIDDLKENNKEFVNQLESQIRENIELRRSELQEEINILESKKNRGILNEKELIAEKKRLSKEFSDFEKGEREKTLQDELIGLQKSINLSEKEHNINLANAKEILKFRDDSVLKQREIEKALIAGNKERVRLIREGQSEENIAIAASVLINLDRIKLINLLLEKKKEEIDLNKQTEEATSTASVNKSLAGEEKRAKIIEDITITQRQREIDQIDISLKNEELTTQERIKLINKRFDLEERILKQKADFQKNIEGKTAEEIELIKERLINALAKLDNKRLQDIRTAKDKQLNIFRQAEQQFADEERAARLKRLEEDKKFINLTADEAIKARERVANATRKELDDDIDERKENIVRQQRLAEQGAENTLAFEKKQLAEAELQRKEFEERERKRQESIKLAEIFLQAYLTELGQPNANPAEAGTKALGSTLLAKGIAGTLASFYEGTEDTGTVSGALDSNGGRLAVLHDNERVLTKEQNKKIGNISNDELTNIAVNHKLSPYLMNGLDLTNRSSTTPNMINVLGAKIDNLNKTIKSRPIQKVDVDKMGNLIETLYKNGVKDTVTYKARRRI